MNIIDNKEIKDKVEDVCTEKLGTENILEHLKNHSR